MATARKLLSLLGKPITGAALRGLVAADRLKASKEEDMKEGLPVAWNFIGKKAGYELLAEDGCVVAVFLYVEKRDGFAAFPGQLPYKGAARRDSDQSTKPVRQAGMDMQGVQRQNPGAKDAAP